MTLQENMTKNKVSLADAAKRSKCSTTWIYLHIKQGKPLGKKTALLVEKWTRGKVRAVDSMHIRN